MPRRTVTRNWFVGSQRPPTDSTLITGIGLCNAFARVCAYISVQKNHVLTYVRRPLAWYKSLNCFREISIEIFRIFSRMTNNR